MGNDPKTSVVNRYGQSWDVSNLFVIGSSTFPTMSGFNPTVTIQALAYMSVRCHNESLQKDSWTAAVEVHFADPRSGQLTGDWPSSNPRLSHF